MTNFEEKGVVNVFFNFKHKLYVFWIKKSRNLHEKGTDQSKTVYKNGHTQLQNHLCLASLNNTKAIQVLETWSWRVNVKVFYLVLYSVALRT